jgi:L-amino acid N-acyltransferase YncA
MLESQPSVTIRVAVSDDAMEIARCHIAAWRDTYRPIVAEEYLNNLSFDEHTKKWVANLQQPRCHTFVAETDQGELIGFINGGPERTGRTDYRGEIYAIYILKTRRGCGVGRKLLARFSEALRESQVTSLIVWALEGNEYRDCYSAWGAREIATGPIKIGTQDLIEVAYGWPDAHAIVELARRSSYSARH